MNKYNRGYLNNIYGIISDISINLLGYCLCHLFFVRILRQTDISFWNTFFVTVIYLLIFLIVGMADQHYDISSFYYFDRLVRRVSLGWMTAAALVVFGFYFTGRAQTHRSFYAAYFLSSYAGHLLSAVLTYRLSRKGSSLKQTLFVGSRSEFGKFIQYVGKTCFPIQLVGYVLLDAEDTEDDVPEGYLGYARKDQLSKIIRKRVIDQVYIMNTHGKESLVQECVDSCVRLGVETRVVYPEERSDCYSHVSSIGNYPVVSYHLNCINQDMDFVKRIIDFVGALVGLAVSSPILLVAALAIKADSDGPVFFTQTRVGKNGRHFQIYKLRTMTTDAEARKCELLSQNEMDSGLMFKIKEDPRVTKVGAFLRKTSIDEIPQFFNVLKGDMSLVGTRPPTVDEVAQYKNEHWRRLRIKPGITGLWQVSGRNAVNTFDEVVELDTKYIMSWTVWKDIEILLKTVAVVLRHKGAY